MLPSQLAGEPIIPLLRIVEARQYVRAVEAIEAHSKREGAKPEDAPKGPIVDLVCEILSLRLDEEHGDNG